MIPKEPQQIDRPLNENHPDNHDYVPVYIGVVKTEHETYKSWLGHEEKRAARWLERMQAHLSSTAGGQYGGERSHGVMVENCLGLNQDAMHAYREYTAQYPPTYFASHIYTRLHSVVVPSILITAVELHVSTTAVYERKLT